MSPQEFDALFSQILRDPTNRAFNLQFIELALAMGEYEAAIAILDLLLFFDEDDSALLMLSGEAYFALKSYEAARSIYERIQALPAASPEQQAFAAQRIEEIERLTLPSPWQLYAQSGLRYQTNATAGPGNIDGIDPSAVAQPDWNAFVLGVLSYRQPVGEGAIEADLTTYYADQFEVQRLDLGVAELIAGPRLPIASGENTSLSLKPYGLAGGVLLGDDPYLGAYGGGLSARARFGDPVTLEPYFEYRDRTYFNSDDYPTVSDQTGELLTYALSGRGALGSAVSWFGRSGLHDNEARVESESYDEIFVDFALRFQLDGGQAGSGHALLFTPSFSVEWTEYGAPDPVDAGVTREDFEWMAGGRLDVPLFEALGLGVEVQYTRNDSNLSRFDYDNLQVTSGPTLRF